MARLLLIGYLSFKFQINLSSFSFPDTFSSFSFPDAFSSSSFPDAFSSFSLPDIFSSLTSLTSLTSRAMECHGYDGYIRVKNWDIIFRSTCNLDKFNGIEVNLTIILH